MNAKYQISPAGLQAIALPLTADMNIAQPRTEEVPRWVLSMWWIVDAGIFSVVLYAYMGS